MNLEAKLPKGKTISVNASQKAEIKLGQNG